MTHQPSQKQTPPPPVKAYKNGDFLSSAAARQIRVMCEFTEPAERLKRAGVENFLVFFGSARTRDPALVQSDIDALERKRDELGGLSGEEEKQLGSFRREMRSSRYYGDAVKLAHDLTKWSIDLHDPKHRFYICSGGGPGIMEAANRGASEAGGKSIGLGISLPFEVSNNPYITHSLSFEFHYFFVRKYWFLYLAKALILFPGGFGTMDELFEMLTLIQTRKTEKRIPIVLYDSKFWNELINFEAFVDWGVISPEDLELFKIIDDLDEARDYIISEVTEHYIKPGKTRTLSGG